MENTPENKAKFFAQYFRQNIFANWLGCPMAGFEVFRYEFINGISAKLKPLEFITNEDARKVAEIFTDSPNINHSYYTGTGITVEIGKEEELEITKTGEISITNSEGCVPVSSLDLLMAYEMLRSKAYALPWMGVSIQQQLEYGWVVLIIE